MLSSKTLVNGLIAAHMTLSAAVTAVWVKWKMDVSETRKEISREPGYEVVVSRDSYASNAMVLVWWMGIVSGAAGILALNRKKKSGE